MSGSEPGHLDECNFGYLIADDDGDPIYDTRCICDRLRACEARVLNEYRQQHDGISERYYQQIRADALDAAREAVDNVPAPNHYAVAMREDALAAIDALRGKS